jgi:MoaA/NifB/PqqE/SkfB family radical SAM enzyme
MNLSQDNIKNVIEYKRIQENITVVDWWLGNTCNYKCSYCFSESNKGNKRVPPLKTYENNLDYFLNKIEENNRKAFYILSGGEPTIYADLDLILEKITSSKCYNGSILVTNGSRTINWWQKNKSLLNMIAISFHIESADKDHILKICELLKDKKTTVTIMMHKDRFEDCMLTHQYFIDNGILQNAALCVKALDDTINNTDKLLEYTDEQNIFIKNNYLLEKKEPNSNTHFYHPDACIAIDNKENKYNYLSNTIAHIDPDFKNWLCMIGTEHITIDYSGYIRANCNQKIFNTKYNLYYDNLQKENFNLLNKPVKCEINKCRCLGLYNISKKLPSNIS